MRCMNVVLPDPAMPMQTMATGESPMTMVAVKDAGVLLFYSENSVAGLHVNRCTELFCLCVECSDECLAPMTTNILKPPIFFACGTSFSTKLSNLK